MLFLIEYDRAKGKVVTLKPFPNTERAIADEELLETELRLNRAGIQREVVILEAPTEAALRRTHRRYFETLEQLATLPAA
ncbi:MAG: hypothetical protein HOP19_17515 [Acidobacteria bacterium]|nr:hypothetical protein [Acidobacteriota bacterium]